MTFPAKPVRMGLDGFRNILKLLQSRYPALSTRIRESEALSRWDDAVGPAIAKHTRAIKVEDSVLWVEVDHPIWKSELHYRKRQIIDALIQRDLVITDLLLLDPRKPRRN